MSLTASYSLNGGPEQPCRSFNRNWLTMLRMLLKAKYTTLKDITGAERTCPYPGDGWYYSEVATTLFNGNGGQGNDNRGIVVGSGNAAEDFEANCLDSRIHAGYGDGELYYDVTDQPVDLNPADYGTHNELTLSRRFVNYTDTPITIREFGLYIQSTYSVGGDDASVAYFMVLRDVLSPPLVVLNGGEMGHEEPGQTARITLRLRTYL